MQETEPVIQPQRNSLAEIRADLETKADGLGLGIDPGIMEAVLGLQANGLNTRQSCEGHLERGLAYPWIAVSEPKPDGMDEDESGLLKAQWVESNKRMHPKMNALLDEYKTHEPAIEIGFATTETQEMLVMPTPRPSRDQKTADSLARYQDAMNEFATFLVAKAEAEEARGTAAN